MEISSFKRGFLPAEYKAYNRDLSLKSMVCFDSGHTEIHGNPEALAFN